MTSQRKWIEILMMSWRVHIYIPNWKIRGHKPSRKCLKLKKISIDENKPLSNLRRRIFRKLIYFRYMKFISLFLFLRIFHRMICTASQTTAFSSLYFRNFDIFYKNSNLLEKVSLTTIPSSRVWARDNYW